MTQRSRGDQEQLRLLSRIVRQNEVMISLLRTLCGEKKTEARAARVPAADQGTDVQSTKKKSSPADRRKEEAIAEPQKTPRKSVDTSENNIGEPDPYDLFDLK
ncbi:hypothetical protein [Chitinivibrio alkaliphilus]|uniref:Uncharacterized protein n=1 Tax=Chitinivibrio alkaliphilus ACht1 TaxID=1313304 RepID=U7DB87_9BACT|nr:hypothetical protein [Chitinivibrio alkaliphilus]ERP38818.1 hypothetical protein CALK_0590 [Chitinivibrio alkaliphilus ACht1]